MGESVELSEQVALLIVIALIAILSISIIDLIISKFFKKKSTKNPKKSKVEEKTNE